MISYTRIKGKEIQSEIDLIQTKIQNKILSKFLSTSHLVLALLITSNLQNKTNKDKRKFGFG